ncbi:MAG: manganese efflux pump MntP family protein [Deltaproteobacteria bacterium]|nr:manganese efflux pump MntP family protein [Deltaproteobacteria bacterium]
MDLVYIVGIGFALGLDTFSVGVSAGVAELLHDRWALAKLSLGVGIAHILMSLCGYSLGKNINEALSRYDHWVAFFLLMALGVKMIYDSSRSDIAKSENYMASGLALIIVSIATSLDAFAVGISFGLVDAPIMLASLIIGVIAVFMLCCGVFLGDKIGIFIGKRASAVGGLFLIIIGSKILWEHL